MINRIKQTKSSRWSTARRTSLTLLKHHSSINSWCRKETLSSAKQICYYKVWVWILVARAWLCRHWIKECLAIYALTQTEHRNNSPKRIRIRSQSLTWTKILKKFRNPAMYTITKQERKIGAYSLNISYNSHINCLRIVSTSLAKKTSKSDMNRDM